MSAAAQMLSGLLSGLARDLAGDAGPVKWCKRCGRKHPARAGCALVKVAVPAASGRMVERLAPGPAGD